MSSDVLIVGGGLAAQRCVETLLKGEFGGGIRVVSSEARPPYDRPPLSKGVLGGKTSLAELAFRPAGWYEEQGVELLLGAPAASLDPDGHRVTLGDGTVLEYGRLLIATGSEPRRLELLDGRSNVHYFRTAEDASRLRERLRPGSRLLIIGAGFIGQEIAATARGMDVAVTLLEALPSPLGRILGDEIGDWFAAIHREEGVDLRCSTTAAGLIEGSDGRVSAIVTGEGHELGCEEIVVGIGVLPADGWLYGTGLGGGHVGVEVDRDGRTSEPDIFAAGDVARAFDPRVGAHLRTEHWEAAARMGMAAGRAMLGLDVAPAPLASFWSDQYGLRIQYLGYAEEADTMTLDGDRAARNFSVLWTRDGDAVAGLLVGRPRELAGIRNKINETFNPILERNHST